MTLIVNNQRIYQYTPQGSHIITDEADTMKLLEKKCGYVKPWSMEGKPDTGEKTKPAEAQKQYRKIDFYL